MKKIIATIFILVLCVSTVSAETYKKENLEIISENPVEIELTLAAVKAVKSFFDNLGYRKTPHTKIVFQKKVFYNNFKGAKPVRVYALANSKTKTIRVSSWGTAYTKNRTSMKMKNDTALHRSVIEHELIHIFASCNFSSGTLGHGVSEYVAYAGQIHLMPPEYRQKTLENYPEARGFEHREQINSLVHEHNPKHFGVCAYRDFLKNPGTIREILSGKFDPDRTLTSMLSYF